MGGSGCGVYGSGKPGISLDAHSPTCCSEAVAVTEQMAHLVPPPCLKSQRPSALLRGDGSGALWRAGVSSKLVLDAGKLVGLQFAVRGLAFIATLHAARSLGPEQLGIGAFVIALATQVAVLGDLGLNIAGIRELGNKPESRPETVALLTGLRLFAALVLSALFLIGIWLWRPVGHRASWLLAAPYVFFLVLNPQWIFQGVERVPVFNSIELIRVTVTAGLYLALFQPGTSALMYVAVGVATQGAAWSISYCLVFRYIRINWRLFDWNRAVAALRTSMKAFAVVLTVSAYSGMDIPLATLLLSAEDTGLYRAAQAVVGVMGPLLAIAPMILYPRLIAWKNVSREKFAQKASTAAAILTGVALLAMGGALLLIPILFPMVMGSAFKPAVVPALWLVLAKCFVLVAGVPAWALHAYNLDGHYLLVTFSVAVTSLILNLVLTPKFGLVGLSAVNALSELLILCLTAALLYRFLNSCRAPVACSAEPLRPR